MSPADFGADVRVLWRLLRGLPRTGSHAERLNDFYAPQAERYDGFRARLLHGRADLITALEIPDGAHVVELGCGTGSNLELLRGDDGLASFASIHLVDLCPALLARARQRVQGQANVTLVEADATGWQPPHQVDRVFLSYALTMMPDWRAVLANAWNMLVPGGRLGVIDFYLPARASRPGFDFSYHVGNRFWQRWFAHDGVHLSELHLRALQSVFVKPLVLERRASVPYLPGLQAPYYLFVGSKPTLACTEAGID